MIEHSNKTEVSAAQDLTDQVGNQICIVGTYCSENFTNNYLCCHQLANNSLSTYIRFE